MITFEAKIKGRTVRMFAGFPLKNAAGAIFRTLAQISSKEEVDSHQTERTEENVAINSEEGSHFPEQPVFTEIPE